MLISLIFRLGNKIACIAKQVMLTKSMIVIDVQITTQLCLLTIFHRIESTTRPKRRSLCIRCKTRMVGWIKLIHIVAFLLCSNSQSSLQIRDNVPFRIEIIYKFHIRRLQTSANSSVIKGIGYSTATIRQGIMSSLCPSQNIAIFIFCLPIWIHLDIIRESSIRRIATMIGNYTQNILKQEVLTTIRETYVSREVSTTRTFHYTCYVIICKI